MTSTANSTVSADLRDLQAVLSRTISGEVRFDAYSRAMYATDASFYEVQPVGVVLPRSADDVQAVHEICHSLGVSVLPRGGGTGLSGQTVNHAVVMDFSKYMHHVLEVNPEERWVRTQPGITLDELNRQLRPHGLMFTPDPSTSSRANVGGAMGNNSCGAHSILYGKTVDHVLEMDVVLSDGSQTQFRKLGGDELRSKLDAPGLEGEIYRRVREVSQASRAEVARRFPKIMRRVGGYNLDRTSDPDTLDLTQIMVGSEGTLASVSAAKLNLVPIPKHKALLVIQFRDILEAMEATVVTLEEAPAAVEHMGSLLVAEACRSPGFAGKTEFVHGEPSDMLVVEFSSDEPEEVQRRVHRLQGRLQKGGLGYAATPVFDPAAQARVWDMRKAGLGLLMNVEGPAKPLSFVEDTAVSPEKLPEYVSRFDEILKAHGAEAGYHGHASVGCLHIRPLIDLKTAEGKGKLEAIARDVADLVQEFGGSLAAEHGDGIVRGHFAEKMFGPELVQAFREVKHAFDPKGIMNPNRVFDTPHITDNLRYGEAYSTRPVATRLDFTREGGFAGAVEMCNGMGHCRKVNAGAMCPSYMATREEEHSTRGRANALRFALSGKLPISDLADSRVMQVLDLCLECKSCKSECPSNVDMAKIKYEFLHQYYKSHRIPLRSRLVADIHRLNAASSPVAPIANFVNRSLPARWVNEKLLGIDRDRPMPKVVRKTFEKWFEGRAPSTTGTRGDVVLFHDTFMSFNRPTVGMAATRLLEALGYRVVIVKDRKCCGRPMVSKGLPDKAGANARHNVDRLYPLVEQGVKIVGCEASCVSAIKDEWPDLLGRDPKALAVAEATVMLEELLVENASDGGQEIEWSELSREVKFFGHCHQRALTGTEASIQALSMPPGYRVSEIGAGCCGMAGAFGYEVEHVPVAMAVGEDRLFPAVRAAPSDAEIAVTGVSCREQIAFGAGRRARHLAEVLADALAR